MSLLRQRVVAGLGANAMGQGVNVAIQFLSLPLFLSRWDVATYGTWLLLSALPAYLSMADVGMVTAAGNRMTMALGRNDIQEANKIFHSALMFMAIACAAISAVVFPLISLAPLDLLSSTDHRITLSLLSASVLLMLIGGLADALFRSTGRYASGTVLGNLLRLGEWAGSIAGLLIEGSFAAVALGAFVVRAGGLAVLVQVSRSGRHGVTWARKEASVDEVRALLKPALSFLVFPMSNALTIQGLTLLVGHHFGPASVALFNTYRTLGRVAGQMPILFSHALWPEMSRLYGLGGSAAVRKLYYRATNYGGLIALSISALLYLTAPLILDLWTRGAIEFRPAFMLLMLTYATVGAFCQVPRILLIATNKHIALARWTLGAAVTLLLSATLAASTHELNAIALLMLIIEIALTAICITLAKSLLNTRG